MSDRRSKAETGEGAEENSSQGQRGPSDPLHPSPPQQSYYAHPQQSAHYPYPPSSTREGISHYASYRVRSGSAVPPHRGPPPPHHYGAPPMDPRAAAQQVTPDTRQPPIPSEFMSPPSSGRRRYPQQSPPTSSKPLSKRPRRSGTFLHPLELRFCIPQNFVLSALHMTLELFVSRPKQNLVRCSAVGAVDDFIQVCTISTFQILWGRCLLRI